MPRWKTTENILSLEKYGELFDETWMNYDSVSQYAPPCPRWSSDRKIRFEDVEIWEVIYEQSGAVGVYAAWCPYAHYFVVIENWNIVDEFHGLEGEKRLIQAMRSRNMHVRLNKVWVDHEDL